MSKCCKTSCNKETLSDLASTLKVVAEPNRLKILCLLSSGEKCVCHIEKELSLSQNLVSHHLKVLKDAGLISRCKCGKWRHYSLNKQAVSDFEEAFNSILT